MFRAHRTVRAVIGALVLLACLVGSGRSWSADDSKADDNPYLADPQLTREQLDEFVTRMQRKPRSLHKRPGFNEAILDATERVLAGGQQDELASRALPLKLHTLHFMAAEMGNAKADKELTNLALALENDQRAPVADAARLYALERQALDADDTQAAELGPLLERLKKYCSAHELDGRHLRLASATVRIINRLPDDKAAAEAYREFGGWFAKSEDPELARYGRKIATGPKAKGQPAPAAEPAAPGQS